MNQTDWGHPRPRHQYTYHPRPYPGQKGVLTYNGPLNMTAAAQGYGAYGAGMGGYGGMGYGYGGAYGGAYGTPYGGTYGVRPAYPSTSYSSYYTSPGFGNNAGYAGNYYQGHGGYAYGQGHHAHYGRYANYFFPWQSSYYRAGAVVPYTSPYYAAAYPTTYVAGVGVGVGAATTAAAQAAAATTTAPVQYAYVQAAATPTKLPDAYYTVNGANITTTTTTTTARQAAHAQAQAHANARTATAEDIQFENRRVATERGAYRPRKIKPADAKEDDVFWVRERNGDWHCRPYYQIEDSCYPGTWQMDAEIGFLVFHRE